jgi:hypothetical protein
MSTAFTPWSQGTTLPTLQTLQWTPEQIAANEEIELRKVYACGRLVAICERKDEAQLITFTPKLLTNLRLCAAHIAATRGRNDPFAHAAFALIAKATGSRS